jgi:hypothetical protein
MRDCQIIKWSFHPVGRSKQWRLETIWHRYSVLKGASEILCSPYLRARQTSTAIENALTAKDVQFDVREAVELREITFGLFDGISDEDLPKRFPQEYAHYQKHKEFEGEFFCANAPGREQMPSRTRTSA